MSKYVRTKAENIYFNTFLHYGYLFMNAINIVLGRECPGPQSPHTRSYEGNCYQLRPPRIYEYEAIRIMCQRHIKINGAPRFDSARP